MPSPTATTPDPAPRCYLGLQHMMGCGLLLSLMSCRTFHWPQPLLKSTGLVTGGTGLQDQRDKLQH